MPLETLPQVLRENFKKYGNRVAMRVKDRGIWQEHTWEDYYLKVKHFCLGLISLGLQKGDKVSILGENKPEWFWAELAVQSARGAAVGIFTDCLPEEIKYYIRHSDSTFVVVHDQEQVDKILEIKNNVPKVKKVIYWDPKGLWSYTDPILLSFDEVIKLGYDYENKHPQLFDEIVDHGKGNDIAAFCYTSGTTGLPKGAMLSHRWLVESIRQWGQLDGWFGKNYEYLSFIPPAWITEQGIGIAGSILARMVVNFPEEPETVQENIREIGPGILFFGARLWENLNRMVQARMIDSTFLRRHIYRLTLPLGLKVADMKSGGKKINIPWRILYFLAYHAVFRQLRDRLGLSNLKVVYSAGAAVSPNIIRYFKALGIDIRLFYGSTEQGVMTMPREGDIRPETSGPPVPWVKVKLSDDGEILIKNEYPYSGYYKDSEATEAKMKDGWFYTADFGHMNEDGHLIVIDRMEDLKELAGGKKFSPQFTEIRLRFSPYIKDVLIIGGPDKEYVTAIINIDLDNVGRFAEAHHIAYTTFTDLSQKTEVIDLIKKEIIKVNHTLPEWTRIRRFVNLHKEFDADEDELTRTRKLRRAFVEDKYKELIAALYSNDDTYKVEASVTYRDGRKGTIETSIHINELQEKK
ncbi:MAG TPA: long-chain fatty acid--CoA ligase [Desulfobacteraceae bacterium]|nr:long-chain fatty acid--CoA ligase [Desulfobacteraceae bacterium]